MSILGSVTEKLPDWFVATPVGRSLIDQHKKELNAARQALVDALAGQRRDLQAACDKHDQLMKPLDAAARAAKAKFETAETLLVQGMQARAEAVHAIEGRIRDLEHDLTRAADPRIDEARWAMTQRWEQARLTLARSSEVPTGHFVGTSARPEMRRISNQGAIVRLSEAMAAARRALDKLKTKNPDDLEGAIKSIMEPVDAAWAKISELDQADGPQAA